MDFFKKPRLEADFSGNGGPNEVHETQGDRMDLDPDPDPGVVDLGLDVRQLKRPMPSISVHPNKYCITFSSYTIETTLTCKSSTASEWVRRMTEVYGSRPTVVGLSAEWMLLDGLSTDSMPPKPIYQSYDYYRVATLQLCIHGSCLSLQMQHLDEFPDSILEFLDNSNFTFVGVDLDDNMNLVSKDYRMDCRRSEDLGLQTKYYYPRIFSHPKPGLRELAGTLCGWWLEDPEQSVLNSDWKALQLSEAQVTHACIQAFINFMTGDRLQFFISARSTLPMTNRSWVRAFMGTCRVCVFN